MSYDIIIEKEGLEQQFLVVLKPRRIVSGWTNTSGSIYRTSFDLGHVTAVTSNGESLAQAASSSLSSGEFFYDTDDNYLYVWLSGSADPATKTVVATYEIYAATYDAHWYRNPIDPTSEVVYWEPIVSQSVQIKTLVDEVFFGVLPTQTTNIILNNAEKILNKHLYYGSLNKAEIIVWHWLNDLDTANIKKVFIGRCGSHTWTDKTLDIQVQSSIDFFDKEFRPNQSVFTYSQSDYPRLDPQYEGQFIRYIYGVVDGLRAVNIDLGDIAEPTTSDNRDYAICAEGSTMFSYLATVAASPSSTSTRTYLNDATGFSVGDSVWINKTTDEYRTITSVDYSANYIEHAALSSGAAASNDQVSRGRVARVEVFQNDQLFLPQFTRDYTEAVDSNGVLTISFSTSLESNLSMPETMSGIEDVAVRVYGKQNDVTLNSSSFGTNNSSTGNLLSAPVILLDILKRYALVNESDIDISSFTTALTSAPDKISFAVSKNQGDEMPTIKQLIADICKTSLISFFQNEDLKWEIARISAPSLSDIEIEDDEILDGSLSYSFDYLDLYSDFRVDFAYREIGESRQILGGYKSATASSDTAKYLHEQKKELTIESLHYSRSDAEVLAARLAAIYGDRQGLVSLRSKNRFFETHIDDVVKLTRASMPGFEYSAEVERSVNLNMRSGSKGLRSVELSLNDLKGVTDNSGEF